MMIIFNVELKGTVVFTAVAPEGMSPLIAQTFVDEATDILKNTNDVDNAKQLLFSWGFVSAKTYTITMGAQL